MTETVLGNRWLPPSPHREEILKVIDAGRAHIEERGHGISPLLVFEDGGAIELHKVRHMMTHRGMQLVSTDDASEDGQTRHSDVCGSIDELKALLKEYSEPGEREKHLLDQLLSDACYMISRMQRRCGNYERFAADIASLSKQMAAIGGPEPKQAYRRAEEIRADLQDSPETVISRIESLYELAEGIRDVANKLERCLSGYKESAIEVGVLYEEIKGGRTWQKKESDAS